jgi:glycine/D-amino acid oxidase-like deaminating enzyme
VTGDRDHDDLRGGRSLWLARPTRVTRPPLDRDLRCDAVVVGAGITGSLVAYRLTALGHRVVVIDRERPGLGSISASTAMLMWEIDRSLGELTDLYGFEAACDVYHRSRQAVLSLISLVRRLGVDADLRVHDSLYLAGDGGIGPLRTEHELRRKAGLPGELLDGAVLCKEFGFDRAGAIWSPDAADADPVRLAQAVMTHARTNGARLYDAEAVAYETHRGGVLVQTGEGRQIEAAVGVLATGYVMPDIVRTDLHATTSSWALATVDQPPAGRWRDDVLVWEDADPYLYARTTPSGHIVAGGEDDDVTDPDERDRLIPAKTAAILAQLKTLYPGVVAEARYAWSGEFGETADGLPLIGPVPGHPGFYAAYGYGGNGITFSLLAAHTIGDMIAGRREQWHDRFAVDRAVPGHLSSDAS